MSRLWFGFGLVAIVFAALSGCGQKGPLYLPDDEQAPMNEAPMLPGEESPGEETSGAEMPAQS